MDKRKRSRFAPGTGIALGIAIGVAIGAALGHLAVGIAIGVAIGAAFEPALGKASKCRRGKDGRGEER